MAGEPWSRQEVEAVVGDYLEMLALELRGESFNKAARNRALRGVLTRRSRTSVEFKHRNISAALLDLGFPYVDGYLPADNAQELLREVVREQLPSIERLVERSVAAPQNEVSVPDVLDILVEPPTVTASELGETRADYELPAELPGATNYLLREALNRSLGVAGELLVLRYERERLIAAGKDGLATDVEHVAVTRGDRAGYDIRSHETSGKDRFIEVKTTRYGRRTPFYISDGELRFCEQHASAYQLYRLFKFSESPQLFTLRGEIEQHVSLYPKNYLARLRLRPTKHVLCSPGG